MHPRPVIVDSPCVTALPSSHPDGLPSTPPQLQPNPGPDLKEAKGPATSCRTSCHREGLEGAAPQQAACTGPTNVARQPPAGPLAEQAAGGSRQETVGWSPRQESCQSIISISSGFSGWDMSGIAVALST